MAQLLNSNRDQVLIPNLQIAESFWPRLKGLLGTKQLVSDQALWIKQCNSIHTFFMNYAIDCVFVDDRLTVKKVFSQVQPWRVTLPVWGAKSVIEMQSGQIEKLKIQEGDTLYVGS